jgi:hypothetical protein
MAIPGVWEIVIGAVVLAIVFGIIAFGIRGKRK